MYFIARNSSVGHNHGLRRLLIRPGAIGDCIVALPALEHLRADYTEVWVPSAVAPLIRFADCVRRMPSAIDRLGLPGLDPPAAILDHLRTFDSIVSWYGSNQPLFRKRVQELDLPFQFFPALPNSHERSHIVDFFLKLAGAPPGASPRIDAPPQENGAIVIHPFSGSARKNWPLEKFRAVAEHLPARVEWCAAPHEPLAGAIKIDDLWNLARWIAGARLFIGNDCGITHLAAAVGCPVVAIFGPTDPAVWAPRGEKVRIVAGDLHNIPAEDVIGAASELL
jgi:ADP-heptose:LPS heptosyltransferase